MDKLDNDKYIVLKKIKTK